MIRMVRTEVTTTYAIGIMAHIKIRVCMLVQIRLFLEVGKTMRTGLLIIIAGMDPHALKIIRETGISRFGGPQPDSTRQARCRTDQKHG